MRKPDLLQASLVHDGDAVRHDQRLLLVVGNEQRGQPETALQAAHLQLHLLPQLAVERAKGLVEQQQPRLKHGGAGERDALLLAARELLGQALGHASKLDHLQGRRDPLGDLSFCHAPHGQRIGNVAGDAHVREQGIVLEHHADVALCGIAIRDIRPSTRMRPESAVSKPAITLSSVVLPEPLGPRMVTNSPADTPRVTSARAATSPKLLLAPSMSRRPACAATRGAGSLLIRTGRALQGRGRAASRWRQRSRLGQHPLVPALAHFCAVLGPPLLVEPKLLLEIIGIERQQWPDLLGYVLVKSRCMPE